MRRSSHLLFHAALAALIIRIPSATAAASTAATYDLIVIGGGSAGLTAAKFASRFGKSVALIEKERLGGDCTWTGCVPSKALLASADSATAVRTAESFGVKASASASSSSAASAAVDMSAIKARIRRIIGEIYDADDSPEALKALGIDSISGAATLVDQNSISVEEAPGVSKPYTASKGIVLATGARPRSPNSMISGIEGVPYLTYEQIFELDELPTALTVVGGGPIGCELAQGFARLGSSVTLVAPSLLPGHEPEVAADLAAALAEDGVKHVASRAKAVSGSATSHTVSCADGTSIDGTTLLVAVGRVPVVEGLGLEGLGVALSGKTGGILVDDKLRTNIKGVYAAGDCTGDQQFTHYAGFQGAIAARNILLPLSDPGVLSSSVPGCVFTEPEVARVGLTEAHARAAAKDKAGKDVAVAYRRMSKVDRAITMGKSTHGFIKLIYKPKDGSILGATVMGPSAGELISEISVAMAGKVKLPALASVMHAYPTVSIALQQMAAEVYYDQLEASMPLYNLLSKVGL